MTLHIPEWFMNRYRGTNGYFGRLVLKADVEWLKGIASTVRSESFKVKAQRTEPGDPEYHH